MLLWEALNVPCKRSPEDRGAKSVVDLEPVRLPYDTRCSKVTKSGKRCRGRIRKDSEYCPLHDPAVEERRLRGARPPVRRRNRLANLPDGYLRKLTTRAAVGAAMDRLYRELRLGLITPDMAKVLFGVLCRILDSGLADGNRSAPKFPQRTKAGRLRPKMMELLTRAEHTAWRKAVSAAPESVLVAREKLDADAAASDGASADRPLKLAL